MAFSNWSGLVVSDPAEVREVATVDDVRRAVGDAAANGWVIRTAGTKHSHSPVLSNDGGLVLLTDGLAGPPRIVHVDDSGEGALAAIAAGTKLAAVGEPLWDAGWSLSNQGDVDVQSIAGLIGTGVHGTGRELRSISDSVVDAEIVTASGDVVHAADDAEVLEAARLNLGALGVVTEVTLAVVPAYHLHERHWRAPMEEVMESLDDLIAATRHFEFFWYPVDDLAHAKSLQPVDGPTDPMDGTRGEYVDRAYRTFPSVRSNQHTEMEYSVPAEAGPTCFGEIRELMRTDFPDIVWPAEYRTVAADEGIISPANGRATVTISVHQGSGLPYEDFFAACERIFRSHDGRPHWGKFHNLTADDMAEIYGAGWTRFDAVQRRLDPDGTFLNGHLRSLLRP